jgi:hypothetical protein
LLEQLINETKEGQRVQLLLQVVEEVVDEVQSPLLFEDEGVGKVEVIVLVGEKKLRQAGVEGVVEVAVNIQSPYCRES